MEENVNLIDSFYLPTIEKNVTENSSAVKILNDNHIDSHELLGINQEAEAGTINLNYKDEKQKEADGIDFVEGAIEFAKDIVPSSYQSMKLAGVNGADVVINMVPLFDRLFSLDPNYKPNQDLMTTMKNWSNHLDGARENIKAKRDQNQKVAQFVSMIFQDVPYAVPLHKKFKNMGMPKWLSMPLAYGLGYALGFDEEKTSMFLNSKDVQAIKSLINITENTPEDKLFDNVWQAVEGTGIAWAFPQIWKSIKFAKRNIPKLNTEKVGQAAGITATGGAVVKSVLDIDGNNTISKQTKNK
jgi:hypothetical protein